MWPADTCLYLEEAALHVWQARPASFAPVEDVAAFLRARPRHSYRLLINQRREQLLPETLPPLPGSTYAQFAHSRLRRLFPDTPWRSVVPRAKRTASTDITWLALSETPALRRVLAAFADSGAALAGIYSVVQLLPLDLHGSDHLLISEHLAHLRCTLIENGSVRASQLFPAGADSADDIRQFLTRARNSALPLVLFGSPAWREALALPAGSLPLAATQASLHPLLTWKRRWPREQFALPEQRAAARQRNWARYLWLSCALSLLVTGAVDYGGRRENAQLQARIAQEKQRLAPPVSP